MEQIRKNIQELGDYAAKLEIKLVVEALTPYESNFFTRANDLVELFRRVDNPYVVGMCDIVPPLYSMKVLWHILINSEIRWIICILLMEKMDQTPI